MLATDSVKTFDHDCFRKECGPLIMKTRQEHADFDKTWKCLTTSSDGSCVEGETWSDFPAYQMNVMDCGHQNKCLTFDMGTQSLLEEDDTEVIDTQHGRNDDSSGILAMSPNMNSRLVVDTVSDFKPKCFETQCKNLVSEAEKQHPDFTKTWDCLKTAKNDKGNCGIGGKDMGDITWSDFSTYEMNIMDCGKHSGCLSVSLDNTDASFIEEGENDVADGKDMAVAQDEDFMNSDPSSFLEDFDLESLFDKDELDGLSDTDRADLKLVSKNKMEDIAVMEAVLQSFQELEEKKGSAEVDTQEEFDHFYNTVLEKLNKVGDTSKVDRYNLETRIAKATEEVAKAAKEVNAADEKEVRKSPMASMSVDSEGRVHREGANLRTQDH